jgi:hypothetical protein
MSHKRLARPSPAMIVAMVALAAALAGTATALPGKNKVDKNDLKKKVVRAKNVKKNAIESKHLEDGTVQAADIAAGVIANDIADVTGSATGGPRGSLNTNATSPLPLTGTTTFTPRAGQVSALAAEARFTIATTNAMQFCSPAVSLLLNGQPTRAFLSPDDGDSTTLVSRIAQDAGGPFGLLSPGTPLRVTAQLRGDSDCTATSRLNRVEVRIVQID